MMTLPIKKKWFDMILRGEKIEEYREIKPYYISRFKKIFDMYPYSAIPSGREKREIRFRNGYGSSRPEFIALCTLEIKTGKPEWGAEPNKEYYVLKILEIKEVSENAIRFAEPIPYQHPQGAVIGVNLEGSMRIHEKDKDRLV